MRKTSVLGKRTIRRSIQWLGIFFFVGILGMISVISLGRNHTWLSGEQSIEKQHQKFITLLAPVAQEVYQTYGVLPSVSLAQAILESNWGDSLLSSEYYNLYGMKSFGDAPSVDLETEEFQNGEWITIVGRFRVYNSWRESMEDHAKLMVRGVDWNPNLYQPVLHSSSYIEAAQALQNAGYATDPNYAEKLIRMIEEYHLYRFDKVQEEKERENQ